MVEKKGRSLEQRFPTGPKTPKRAPVDLPRHGRSGRYQIHETLGTPWKRLAPVPDGNQHDSSMFASEWVMDYALEVPWRRPL